MRIFIAPVETRRGGLRVSGSHIACAAFDLAGAASKASAEMGPDAWFRVVAIDAAGRRAWTYPIWLDALGRRASLRRRPRAHKSGP